MNLADLFIALFEGVPIEFPKELDRDTTFDYRDNQNKEELTKNLFSLISAYSKDSKDQAISDRDMEKAEAFIRKIKPDSPEFKAFKQLLPFMQFAAKKERAVFLDNNPYENAARLAILFGDAKQALQYLKKFQDTYPKSQNPIHEACKFQLPKEEWDILLWRQLAAIHMPNSSFLRILQYADSIEKYVKQNYSTLHAAQQKMVEENYRQYLASEFDKLNDTEESFLQKTLDSDKTKNMLNKNIQTVLNIWAREQLKLPANGKLNAQQLTQIKNFMSEPVFKQKELEVKHQIMEKHKTKVLSTHKKKKTKQSKETFIAERMFQDAKIIEANVNTICNKIFSIKTDLKTLSSYAEKVCYQNAQLSPELAKLFFEYGISEEGFRKYLGLTPKDDIQHIPDVFIDGKELNVDGFYIKKLSSSDPRCAIIGKLTSCCQYIDGPGSSYVEHSIESKYAGVYVLCKKSGPVPSDDDLIISQTWAWRGKTNRIVFDSIESNKALYEKFKNVIDVTFNALAQRLVTQFSVPEVTVGVMDHCQTPDSFKRLATLSPEFPIGYKKYNDQDRRDSHNQCILASRFELSKDAKEYATFIKNVSIRAAIKRNDLNLVKKMFEMGFEIKPVNESSGNREDKASELLIAAKYADLEMVKYLLSKGMNIRDTDSYNMTILHYAVEGNDPKVLSFLLENNFGLNLEAKANIHGTPLLFAIDKNKFTAVQTLIEKKSDFNSPDSFDSTPLYSAVVRNCLEITKLLLDNNTDTRQIHRALEIAIERGFVRMVKLLIEAKNILDCNQLTSYLAEALKANNLPIIKYLIEKGADVNKTPMAQFITNDCDFAMIKFLVEQKADVNTTHKSSTSFELAVNAGRVDIAEFLIKNGAKLPDDLNKLFETVRKDNQPGMVKLFMSLPLKSTSDNGAFTFFKNTSNKEVQEHKDEPNKEPRSDGPPR